MMAWSSVLKAQITCELNGTKKRHSNSSGKALQTWVFPFCRSSCFFLLFILPSSLSKIRIVLDANRQRILTHVIQNNYGDMMGEFDFSNDKNAIVNSTVLKMKAQAFVNFVNANTPVYQGPVMVVWGSDFAFKNSQVLSYSCSSLKIFLPGDVWEYVSRGRRTQCQPRSVWRTRTLCYTE